MGGIRLLFVADGRSPIALNWISYFIKGGHEVHLVSTFPYTPDLPLASQNIIRVAFSGVKSIKSNKGWRSNSSLIWGASLLRFRTFLRQWLGPLTLSKAAIQLQHVIAGVQPDLVHAMRIPYEGMLAALARPPVPLVISVWGNDFTLHAPSTPLMKRYTLLAMQRADALHTDCQRDSRLACGWGFEDIKPQIVLPGNGGVQRDVFYPAAHKSDEWSGGKVMISSGLAMPQWTVINPRGFRAYVRNDSFFRAIPLVLERQPQARFLCPSMASEPQAERWCKEFRIGDFVNLLPPQTRLQMAELFRRSRVTVSPTTHDGTPNTLLEAMACGCLPVAGDLESLREWITPGMNGLLIDPADPHALANAIVIALEQTEFYERARRYNLRLVSERAEYPKVMEEARHFYYALLNRNSS